MSLHPRSTLPSHEGTCTVRLRAAPSPRVGFLSFLSPRRPPAAPSPSRSQMLRRDKKTLLIILLGHRASTRAPRSAPRPVARALAGAWRWFVGSENLLRAATASPIRIAPAVAPGATPIHAAFRPARDRGDRR